jgi:hypothetical protein
MDDNSAVPSTNAEGVPADDTSLFDVIADAYGDAVEVTDTFQPLIVEPSLTNGELTGQAVFTYELDGETHTIGLLGTDELTEVSHYATDGEQTTGGGYTFNDPVIDTKIDDIIDYTPEDGFSVNLPTISGEATFSGSDWDQDPNAAGGTTLTSDNYTLESSFAIAPFQEPIGESDLTVTHDTFDYVPPAFDPIDYAPPVFEPIDFGWDSGVIDSGWDSGFSDFGSYSDFGIVADFGIADSFGYDSGSYDSGTYDAGSFDADPGGSF